MKTVMKTLVVLLVMGFASGMSLALEQATEPAPVAGQESGKIHEVNGTIQDIDLDKRLVTLQKEGESSASEKPMKFSINDKTSITSGDRAMSLDELAAGTAVRITYEKPWFGFLGNNNARSIECK